MRILCALVALAFVGVAFAQRRGFPQQPNPSGFGSVVFPGTGGPPPYRPPGAITSPGFPGNLGRTVAGRPPFGRSGFGRSQGSRAVIVPYPVFVGGYYGGYYGGYPYDSGYAAPPAAPYGYPPDAQQASPPIVIINQNFKPETVNPELKDYSQADLPAAAEPDFKKYGNVSKPYEEAAAQARTETGHSRVSDDQPTIYLIAFKDHTIMASIAYWMEGDTLNYITPQGKLNHVTVGLVDVDFSKQLNQERNVDFNIGKIRIRKNQ